MWGKPELTDHLFAYENLQVSFMNNTMVHIIQTPLTT